MLMHKGGRAMQWRKAQTADLPRIRALFTAVIEDMERGGVPIWDAHYPSEAFPADIEAGNLFILDDGATVAAAFALFELEDADDVQWRAPQAKAVGLGRFAVHPDYQGRGVGLSAIREARRIARARGAQYLRLFVMPVNRPAIRFYERVGFTRAAGVHEEVIDAALTLREYGFEIETADGKNKTETEL